MHNYTGDRAWEDVVDDGQVTINGRVVRRAADVEDALPATRSRTSTPAWSAPTASPTWSTASRSSTPSETGKWLQHILAKAWAAQTDPTLHGRAEEQILAFAYGYATHAAGDMWAHTFINDHALGVFPAVGEILTGVDDAEIALRHSSPRATSATRRPATTATRTATPVPCEVNEDGDPEFSDDASPRIPYAGAEPVHLRDARRPGNPLPVGTCGDGIDDDNDSVVDDGCPGGPYTRGSPEPRRGKLLDFFLDLQAEPAARRGPGGVGLEFTDCNILDPDCYSRTKVLTVHTVRGREDHDRRLPELRGRDDRLRRLAGRHRPTDLDQQPRRELPRGTGSRTSRTAWSSGRSSASPRTGDVRPGTHRDAQNEICRNKTARDDAAAGATARTRSASSTCMLLLVRGLHRGPPALDGRRAGRRRRPRRPHRRHQRHPRRRARAAEPDARRRSRRSRSTSRT